MTTVKRIAQKLLMAVAGTVFIALETAGTAQAAPKVFTGVGADATTAFNAMKAAIGGPDNTTETGPQRNGFRTIDWDGVKLDGTDFNGNSIVIIPNKSVGIPVNRFQSRGIIFDAVYVVSGDGFVSANPGVKNQFPFFSPKNTFAMSNERDIDIKKFTLAGTNKSARTRGFGAIFLDVEKPNTTSIEFFSGSTSLGKYYVPPGPSGKPVFYGVLWDNPVVTSVKLLVGEAEIFSVNTTGGVTSGPADITNSWGGGVDMVATDDFLYAEPTQNY